MTHARSHYPALDTLRTFAIVAVVGHHLTFCFGFDHIHPLVTRTLSRGEAGVDLFFVLSGFLIGRIVLAEWDQSGSLNLRRFWWRRWMRTLPAYYAMLFSIAALDQVFPPDRGWGNFFAYLTFTQAYLLPPPPPRFAWSWSLATEEIFYLLFPIVFLAVLRTRLASTPRGAFRLVAVAALLVFAASREWTWQTCIGTLDPVSEYYQRTHWTAHHRADGLAAGLLVATMGGISGRWSPAALLLALLGAGVLWYAELPLVLERQQHALWAAAFALLVAVSVGRNAWAEMAIPGMLGCANLLCGVPDPPCRTY